MREKRIRIILQDLPERNPELADVPCLVELGRSDEEKQVLALYGSGGAIGRSIVAPLGLPADTTRILRAAFMTMTGDPEFKADVQKSGLELDPLSGETLAKTVTKGLEIPEQVRQRAKSVFGR
jgi:tripartite-type tricarboxylate transporter receptor subunit TctC